MMIAWFKVPSHGQSRQPRSAVTRRQASSPTCMAPGRLGSGVAGSLQTMRGSDQDGRNMRTWVALSTSRDRARGPISLDRIPVWFSVFHRARIGSAQQLTAGCPLSRARCMIPSGYGGPHENSGHRVLGTYSSKHGFRLGAGRWSASRSYRSRADHHRI